MYILITNHLNGCAKTYVTIVFWKVLLVCPECTALYWKENVLDIFLLYIKPYADKTICSSIPESSRAADEVICFLFIIQSCIEHTYNQIDSMDYLVI